MIKSLLADSLEMVILECKKRSEDAARRKQEKRKLEVDINAGYKEMCQ